MKYKDYSKKFSAGDVIFSEGDITDQAYIIDEGEVLLSSVNKKGEKKNLETLGVGKLFGELGVIEKSKRTVTATAKSNCTLSIISQEQVRERLDNSDPIIKLLVETLIQRNQITTHTRKQKTISILSAQEQTSTIHLTQSSGNNITTASLEKNVLDKIRFENELKKALDKDEFFLNFQPIIATKTGKTAGFEALCRWENPILGAVRADVFVDIAEQTSLIIPISHWIINKACSDFGKLNKLIKEQTKRTTKLFVSINISGKQIINDDKFFDVLKKAVWSNQLKPSNIKLEVTERVFAENDKVIDWIKQCKELGYTIALDDFGTGYSSLSCLKDLNIDNVKIDKSFLNNIEDKKSQVIIKAISNMCSGLNKPVIAEGIETKEQYKSLQELGCHYCQGYYFSKPLDIKTIIEQFNKKAVKTKKVA